MVRYGVAVRLLVHVDRVVVQDAPRLCSDTVQVYYRSSHVAETAPFFSRHAIGPRRAKTREHATLTCAHESRVTCDQVLLV